MKRTFWASFFIVSVLAFSFVSYGNDLDKISKDFREGKIDKQEALRRIEQEKNKLRLKIEENLKKGESTKELMRKSNELQEMGEKWKKEGMKKPSMEKNPTTEELLRKTEELKKFGQEWKERGEQKYKEQQERMKETK